MLTVPGRIFPDSLLHPPVACPACGTAVQGYVSGYELPSPADACVTHAEASGDVHVSRLQSVMVYVLHPCYCEANQYWVSAFVGEMRQRERGRPPGEVEGTWRTNQTQRAEEIEAELRALCSRRDAALMAGQTARKSAIERDVCLKLTELDRLVPNAISRCQPLHISREVLQWAKQQRLTLPRGASDDTGPAEPAPKITFKQLHEMLCTDSEYRHLTTAQAMDMARAMAKEIEAYVTKGTPVSKSTVRTAERLVPGATNFLVAGSALGPMIDENPEDEFTTVLSRRLKRRLDVRRRQPPPPDTPED